jgi:hypothetical protein
MDDDRVQEIRLPMGASQRISLKRGTVILVRCGRVVIRQPTTWLAERIVTTETQLGAEERFVATSVGSVELAATHSADVVVISGAARGWFEWLWQLVYRLWRYQWARSAGEANREPYRHG